MHPIIRSAAVLLTIELGASVATGLAAQGGAPSSPSSSNPACALLTAEEIRAATGRDYDRPTPGDDMGEGIGGGASCQWGGPSFMPGEARPLLSVVFIPPGSRGSYTESSLQRPPMKGCTRETLRGVGDLGYLEICERDRGAVAYIKAGRNDVMVQADPEEGKPPASSRPVVLALAKTVVAKARAK